MKRFLFTLILTVGVSIAEARDYPATVTDVYDGDTFTLDVDLGMGVVLKAQKIRLLFYDAPEVRGDERERGLEVRDQVRSRILDKKVILRTDADKKGKYGRWLGEIIIQLENHMLDIGTWLLSEGLVVRMDY